MDGNSKGFLIWIGLGAKSEKIFNDLCLLYKYSKDLYIFILDAKKKYSNILKMKLKAKKPLRFLELHSCS